MIGVQVSEDLGPLCPGVELIVMLAISVAPALIELLLELILIVLIASPHPEEAAMLQGPPPAQFRWVLVGPESVEGPLLGVSGIAHLNPQSSHANT